MIRKLLSQVRPGDNIRVVLNTDGKTDQTVHVDTIERRPPGCPHKIHINSQYCYDFESDTWVM